MSFLTGVTVRELELELTVIVVTGMETKIDAAISRQLSVRKQTCRYCSEEKKTAQKDAKRDIQRLKTVGLSRAAGWRDRSSGDTRKRGSRER